MRRSPVALFQYLKSRGFCSSRTNNGDEKLVTAVLFERLPVVLPKINPAIYAFEEFSLRWNNLFRRKFPDEVLSRSEARGKGDYQIEYTPAPRITEADKTNDRKSLQRALDSRLYLLLYGSTYGAPDGKPVWHFPEKAYENEETLRKCAEAALNSVVGDLSDMYFVGNAPMAHMVVQPKEETPEVSPFKRFFFKSQVLGRDKYTVGKCEDYVWVTKDELMEYLPEHTELLDKMIIHIR
ncbi:hypothetical protein QJS04_geneDACA007852 [Acorus gramineus]|uniref:Large ribosomal subunit protein mL46 n=1 Tax=Acorus gramineus TaxID=55184 RepID=A0AAV9B8F5_ACOGR|nr:hypothetical protein QJS04_geneDACA007852 [Acorus gramineus]